MNTASDGLNFSLFDKIYKPERSERDIRSSLVCVEGRERYVVSQDRMATALNYGEAARQLVS